MTTLPSSTPSSSTPLVDSRTISSILECSLCLSMVCEPVSISCGHSFCRVCLVKSLRRHKKRCPTCREICHITPETAPENIMIKAMALALDADGYNSRLAETVSEKATWSTVYPIFYYNTAMFPGSRLSLHLFEPRYKIMMQRVVNSTKSFAYVPNFTNYHAAAGDIALVAKLKEVEFLPDGRCLLESVLGGRYKIVDHYVEDGTQGLHFCRLEALQDLPLDADAADRARQLVQRGVELSKFIIEVTTSAAAVERQFGAMPSVESVEEFSLWLAALCPLPEREKAQMLMTQSTVARLQRCVDGLQAYVNQINTRRQAASVLSAAGTTVSSASSALGNIISSLLGRRGSRESNEEEGETARETVDVSMNESRDTDEGEEDEDAMGEEEVEDEDTISSD